MVVVVVVLVLVVIIHNVVISITYPSVYRSGNRFMDGRLDLDEKIWLQSAHYASAVRRIEDGG